MSNEDKSWRDKGLYINPKKSWWEDQEEKSCANCASLGEDCLQMQTEPRTDLTCHMFEAKSCANCAFSRKIFPSAEISFWCANPDPDEWDALDDCINNNHYYWQPKEEDDADMVIIDEEPEPETHQCKDILNDYSITKYGNFWTLCESGDWGLGVKIKFCPFCGWELGTIRSDTIEDEDGK